MAKPPALLTWRFYPVGIENSRTRGAAVSSREIALASRNDAAQLAAENPEAFVCRLPGFGHAWVLPARPEDRERSHPTRPGLILKYTECIRCKSRKATVYKRRGGFVESLPIEYAEGYTMERGTGRIDQKTAAAVGSRMLNAAAKRNRELRMAG